MQRRLFHLWAETRESRRSLNMIDTHDCVLQERCVVAYSWQENKNKKDERKAIKFFNTTMTLAVTLRRAFRAAYLVSRPTPTLNPAFLHQDLFLCDPLERAYWEYYPFQHPVMELF